MFLEVGQSIAAVLGERTEDEEVPRNHHEANNNVSMDNSQHSVMAHGNRHYSMVLVFPIPFIGLQFYIKILHMT